MYTVVLRLGLENNLLGWRRLVQASGALYDNRMRLIAYFVHRRFASSHKRQTFFLPMVCMCCMHQQSIRGYKKAALHGAMLICWAPRWVLSTYVHMYTSDYRLLGHIDPYYHIVHTKGTLYGINTVVKDHTRYDIINAVQYVCRHRSYK